jgi:hypothetical protein
MMKDPRIWGKDVQLFKPERFLGEQANNLPDVLSIPFGFGKRYVIDALNDHPTFLAAFSDFSVIRTLLTRFFLP